MSKSAPVFSRNVSLKPYNTLQVAAQAAYFIEIETVDQLKACIKTDIWQNHGKIMVGGGSNLLFMGDVDAIVVKMAIKKRTVVGETSDHIFLSIGAGENWHNIVTFCVNKGWGGIENLALIPGTTGAAPIQNIGAYGVELKDVFEELTAVNFNSGEEQRFSVEQCQFGYRDSIFKQQLKGQQVITDVTLRLDKNPSVQTSYSGIRQALAEQEIDAPSIRDVFDAVCRIRQYKLPDPAQTPNAGSFFKNPVIGQRQFEQLKTEFEEIPGYSVGDDAIKIPAGWLIDKAGLKGVTDGPVGTYHKQALVLVNHGGATGTQLWNFAQQIQTKVQRTFGITLEAEVNIIS